MNIEAKSEKLPWTKPKLRSFELGEEEIAEILKSKEPISKLVAMKPELLKESGND